MHPEEPPVHFTPRPDLLGYLVGCPECRFPARAVTATEESADGWVFFEDCDCPLCGIHFHFGTVWPPEDLCRFPFPPFEALMTKGGSGC